jgi:hypothetical protein
VRRTTTETAKDQKTSSRALAGEERNLAHVSSARFRAEQEGQRAEDRVPSTLPPTGRRPTFSVPAQSGTVAVGHPPKYGMDGAGRQRRTSAFSTHSCGPAPLPYEDQVYRRT